MSHCASAPEPDAGVWPDPLQVMGQNASWDASNPVELVGLEVVIRALLPQCDYRDERVCTGGAAVSLSSGMAALQNFTCFRKVRKSRIWRQSCTPDGRIISPCPLACTFQGMNPKPWERNLSRDRPSPSSGPGDTTLEPLEQVLRLRILQLLSSLPVLASSRLLAQPFPRTAGHAHKHHP